MNTVNRFRTDERGAIALTFALALLPLLGSIGAAVDYSAASLLKTKMQKAVDGTALALVSRSARLSDAELSQEGERVFKAMFQPDPSVAQQPVKITRNARTIKVSTDATMSTAIIRVLGIETMDVGAATEVVWRDTSSKTQLALVLDNTGSMNEIASGKPKIEWLKEATKGLLQHLNDAAVERDDYKVSLVPFDTQVRLDASTHRDASWLRLAPADRSRWNGYVQDRGDDARRSDYDTNDAPPNERDPDSLYPAVIGSRAANLATMQPLTAIGEGYQSLRHAVERMRGVGATNITIGAAWGMATLSDHAPFTEASNGSGKVKKVMVIVTDGDNTKNRWDGNGQENTSETARIDARTSMACTNAKAKDIKVITIRLVEGNARLLNECASIETDRESPNYGKKLFFDVKNAPDLQRVFDMLPAMIKGTRLAV